jgi:4,5-DOPA dioxygenase extradiol
MSQPIPAAFIGHGSPMNAIETNAFTEAWAAFGAALPAPRAIVAISAHWDVPGGGVTGNEYPPTIHDFGGFPRALFEMRYPAPGDPALARTIANLLALDGKRISLGWGLDHGTWSVLTHLFPAAEIPVVQVAVDTTQDAAFHWQLGERLGELRDQGVLVVGSGNIVHNLAALSFGADEPAPWNARFDADIGAALERNDRDALVSYAHHPDAAIAAPDAEHFAPVLAIAGLRRPGDTYRTIVTGSVLGSISMRSFALG